MPSGVNQHQALPENQQSSAGTGITQLFQRIFTRQFLYVSILILLPAILVQPLRTPTELLRDADLWWHLANARNLLSNSHFVRIEPFSFSVAGEPWINPEWLSEIPYWLSYNLLHLTGIYVMTWLAICANLVFVYWRSYRRSCNATAAFWAGALALGMMTVNAGARMILLGYVALSSELAILEAVERGKRALLWALPLLFCLWINLHGTWIIGLGLFVLYLVCGTITLQKGSFNQQARSARENRRFAAVLSACLAALFLNPYGWRLVYNPIDMMLHQKLNIANVSEWQPLQLQSFAGTFVVLCAGLFVLSNLMSPRKWKIHEIAFTLFAFYAAFGHTRFTFLAAVIVTPLLAEDMNRAFSASEGPARTIPLLNGLIGFAVILWSIYIIPSEQAFQSAFNEVFPSQCLATIQPSWRTFNRSDLGGIMAFETKPSFIDSRLDTFEHHGVLLDYLDTISVWQVEETLDRFRIDHVLFPEHTPLAYFLQHSSHWHVLKREGKGTGSFLLFERVPTQPLHPAGT